MWLLFFLLGRLASPVLTGHGQPPPAADPRLVAVVAEPRQLRLYYQDEHGRRLGSLGQLRSWLAGRGHHLTLAMNGGMYAPGGRPQGLLVENGQTRVPLDTARGPGNFYLQPNGVFYLTRAGQAGICATRQFRAVPAVAYATQSGPLLVAGGQRNPLFTAGSANLVVRNGVGILPDGRVLLALSRRPISFYDFATFFQRRGCREALYLDGFVSRLYWPAGGWRQTDGDFGAIIGVAQSGAAPATPPTLLPACALPWCCCSSPGPGTGRGPGG